MIMKQTERRFSKYYFLVAFLSVILIGISTLSFYQLCNAPGVKFVFEKHHNQWINIDDDPATGVKKGDILLSINGVSSSEIKTPYEIFSILRGGKKVTIKIQRAGKILELNPTISRRFKGTLLGLVFLVSFILICLFLYLWITKSLEFNSFILGMGSALLALLILNFYPYLNWMRFLYLFSLYFTASIWIHLTIRQLPEIFLERWKKLPLYFYGFSLIAFLFSSFIIVIFSLKHELFLKFKWGFLMILWVFVVISALIYITVAVLPFVFQSLKNLGFTERIKFKFISFSNTIGIIPIILLFYTVPELSHIPAQLKSSIYIFYIFGLPFTLLLPLGFALIELKEEHSWIENFFFRGRIYFIMFVFLLSVYFILVFLAVKLFGTYSFFKAFLYFLFFILGILIFPIKSLLEEALTKPFGPEEYDFQEVVERFNNEVFSNTDGDGLINFFFNTVTHVLKLNSAFLFIPEGHDYYKKLRTYNLSMKAVDTLTKEPEALFKEIPPWGDLKFLREKEESELLSVLSRDGIELLLYIRKYNKIWGVFGAGTKRERTFLNPRDLALLRVLATDLLMGIEAIKLVKKEEGEKTLKLKEMIKSMELEKRQFEVDAYSDELTGISNRRYFMKALQHEIERSRRFEENLSILMMDLDNLKDINDTYGHLCGDMVLKEIASAIQKRVRKIDIFARYGGDEFSLLLVKTGKKWAAKIAEEIREHVEKRKLKWDCEIIKVTISIGVYSTNFSKDPEETMESFIEKADRALYEAKKEGKNRVCIYSYTRKEKTQESDKEEKELEN